MSSNHLTSFKQIRSNALSREQGNVLEEAFKSSAWPVAQFSERPEITLARWSVMEAQYSGERCFVGYNIQDREGRVSTDIQSFDLTKARGVTRSGRIYQLDGPPGYDSDGDWVWSMVRSRAQSLEIWRDVSADLQLLFWRPENKSVDPQQSPTTCMYPPP